MALNANPGTDLLLLDLNMPGNEELLGLVRIRKLFPTIPVIVVSATELKDVVDRAMSFGASGYIPKSAKPIQIAHSLQVIPPAAEKYLWNCCIFISIIRFQYRFDYICLLG